MVKHDAFRTLALRTWKHMQTHQSTLVLSALLFALPQSAMVVVGDYLGITNGQSGATAALLVIFFVLSIITLIFSVAAQVFYTIVAAQHQPVDIARTLKQTVPYLVPFVLLPIRIFFWSYGWLALLGLFLVIVANAMQATWLLYTLAALLIIASVVTLVFYGLRYSFAFTFLVRERVSLQKAMEHSERVTRGRLGVLLKNFSLCALSIWSLQLLVVFPVSLTAGIAVATGSLPNFSATAILNLFATTIANLSIAAVIIFNWQFSQALEPQRKSTK